MSSPYLYLKSDDQEGRQVAQDLDLPVRCITRVPNDWHLSVMHGELVLSHPREASFRLSSADIQNRFDGVRTSPLAKACNARKHLKVLDALGGWGVDGFALASLGCTVTITEFNPLVCEVARNLARDLGIDARIRCQDVSEFLSQHDDVFDVIYLDPMFPEHPKSALPSKRMQILEELAKIDTDLQKVFALALSRSRERVVVKNRRNQTPQFKAPDWSISSRTVRFDVYRSTP